jgi:hypothetical protein
VIGHSRIGSFRRRRDAISGRDLTERAGFVHESLRERQRQWDVRFARSVPGRSVGGVVSARAVGGCTGDPATGDFSDAKVIKKFGDVPDDLSAL